MTAETKANLLMILFVFLTIIATYLVLFVGKWALDASLERLAVWKHLRRIRIRVRQTEHAIAHDLPLAAAYPHPGICTREPHDVGPCNGFPRRDCPGYESWRAYRGEHQTLI